MATSANLTTEKFHFVRAVLLAWVLWLGVDFFAHAGLFAALFEQPSPFLLPAEDLFARIPLGYAAFLMYAALTVWVVKTLALVRPLHGAIAGAAMGAVITVGGNLALLSLSTIPLDLASVWTGVQIFEFTVAGLATPGEAQARFSHDFEMETVAQEHRPSGLQPGYAVYLMTRRPVATLAPGESS